MDILAIHGAWSSSVSFNYLSEKVRASWNFCTYDHNRDQVNDIIQRAWTQIVNPTLVVGHSLGGVCGLALHDHHMVRGVLTMASPLQGIDLNMVQNLLSRSSMLPQISTTSSVVRSNKQRIYTKPTVHLIATHGFNPFIYEDSDGVLPIRTQIGWTCGIKIDIPANHYEILQHPETVTAMQRMLRDLE